MKIDNGMTRIPDYTFAGCDNIKSISIPKSVTEIGEGAFQNCSNLTGKLTDIINVTSIGTKAFKGCAKLSGKIVIPTGMSEINEEIFSGCSSIEEVVIPPNIIKIGKEAFKSCTSLANLTVPIVMKYGESDGFGTSFTGCTGISKVRLTLGKDGNGVGTDYDTWSTYSYYYRNTPWYISTVENLEVTLDNGITRIPKYIFTDCDNIKSIIIPNSVTEIGDGAFRGCSNIEGQLTDISNVTSIGEDAFKGCAKISGKIVLPTGMSEINDETFSGCSSIEEVVIPPNIISIGKEAFKNCTSLANLTVPIVMKYGESDGFGTSFTGCTGISKIRLTPGKDGNGIGTDYDTWSTYTYYYQKTPWYISTANPKQIIIEKGISKIGSNTFKNITNTTYYYVGTKDEWNLVEGTEDITISDENFEYSE